MSQFPWHLTGLIDIGRPAVDEYQELVGVERVVAAHADVEICGVCLHHCHVWNASEQGWNVGGSRMPDVVVGNHIDFGRGARSRLFIAAGDTDGFLLQIECFVQDLLFSCGGCSGNGKDSLSPSVRWTTSPPDRHGKNARRS